MKLTFNQKVFIGTVLALVTIGLIYRRKTKSGFVKSLISVAQSEFDYWNKGGKKKENDPQVIDTIQKYWKEGAGISHFNNQQARDTAWSAAFISYNMRKSGAGDDFPYSASHSTYIVQSIKNRKENNSNPFKGYKPSEVKVEVGDLVCYARSGSGANYDTTGSYASHCDLVTKSEKDEAVSVGGNISNSVSETIVPLDAEGKIDKSKDKKGYFVVIKNGKK